MEFTDKYSRTQADREKDRRKLVAAYDALSEKHKKILNLFAVAAPEGLGVTNLFKCLKDLDALAEAGKPLRQQHEYQQSLLADLRQGRLLVEDRGKTTRCHPLLMEVVARRLVQSGDFSHYAAAIRKNLPGRKDFEGNTTYYRPEEVIREARIGIYLDDVQFVERELARFNRGYYYGRDQLTMAGVTWTMLDNPFDPQWLPRVSARLAMDFLSRKFPHPFPGEPMHDIRIALLLIKERLGRPTEKNADDLLYCFLLLIEQTIVRGEWRQAEQLIAEGHRLLPGSTGIMECEAWLLFLQGANEAALKRFAAALQAFRKFAHKKKLFLMRSGGLFYLLALLKTREAERLKEADELFGLIGDNSVPGLVKEPLRYLLDNLLGIKSRVEPGKTAPPAAWMHAHSLEGLIFCLCRFWVDREAAREYILPLASLHQRIKAAGYAWLAAEIAELLGRLGAGEAYGAEAAAFRAAGGGETILDAVKAQSAWERSLAALLALGQGPEADGKEKTGETSRVAWFLEGQADNPSLVPKEQKLVRSEVWTSGRNIPLKRLYEGHGPDFLTAQDRLILAHLKAYKNYRQAWYEFGNGALLGLVGHPHVFRSTGKGPARLEFVKGEPELIVRQDKKGGIRLLLAPAIKASDQVVVVEENSSRFRVIEVRPEHLRIAAILGDKGLALPAQARDHAVKAATAMARLMTVHSDIGVETTGATEIAADSRPYLMIGPHGPGLKVTLRAKPLGVDGPAYPPGTGGSAVIGELNGGRVYANRDLDAEKAKAAAFLKDCALLAEFDDSDREWLIDDPEACLELLCDLEKRGDEIVVAWPEGRKMKIIAPTGPDKFSLNIRSKNDWFAIDGELALDSERVLSLKQLLDLASATPGRFLALGEGEFLALTSEFRRRLDDFKAFSQAHGAGVRVHPLAAQALTGFLSEAGNLETDARWRKQRERLETALEFTPVLPTTLQAELREYQIEGFHWLARLANLGMGACLADDMGLGKTVQALALLLARAQEGPALVVAPTSVCPNWLDEVRRFAPTINAIQFGAGNRQQMVDGLRPFDLLVASYGLLQVEEAAGLLAGVAWSTVILDEAQAIKNFETKRSQGAMKLDAGFKLITTGTPIENHLGELWNLFRFINPGLLGSLESFNERFAGPIERLNDQNARKRLRKLIKPFILRRLKSQVLEELPPRTDIVLHVDLSADELALYEAIRLKALEAAETQGPPGARHLKILAEIMRLRRACCHPRLVMPDTGISGSKLQVFGDTIDELLEGRHKVLVFSQFVDHLAIIREHLNAKAIPYQYLDGSTPARDRKKAVDAFQAGVGDVFLISLKAGGTGLNLTAADYVIHLDPWWNPAVEDQASDRAHRIGQERPVTVYRLVARHTIEEKIVALHHKKRDLADGLLAGTDTAARISTDDLIRLIRGEE